MFITKLDSYGMHSKFTKPLRGVLGGRAITLDNNGKIHRYKIYKIWKRVLIGIILFTIALPYTILAAIAIRFSKIDPLKGWTPTDQWKAIGKLSKLLTTKPRLVSPTLLRKKVDEFTINFILIQLKKNKPKFDGLHHDEIAGTLLKVVENLKPFNTKRMLYLQLAKKIEITPPDFFQFLSLQENTPLGQFTIFLKLAIHYSTRSNLKPANLGSIFGPLVISSPNQSSNLAFQRLMEGLKKVRFND